VRDMELVCAEASMASAVTERRDLKSIVAV
jgi:hypothetical protein